MDARAETILESIINHYTLTAEPVGSRALSKILTVKLSAATIRNVMSDLTDLEFLSQPHTSAGRVPTDKAYRYYVDKLLNSNGFVSTAVNSSPFEEQPLPCRFEDILLEATRELARVTNCTSVVMSPRPAASKLKKIELIQLSTTQVLVVLVTQSGMVRNNIVHFRDTPTQDALNQMSNILCDLFTGKQISKIRQELVERLSDEQEQYGNILPQAIRLGKKAFDISEAGELFIFGRSNMCSFPEFSVQDDLQPVFQVFDEKKALVKILTSAIENTNPHIRIGNENADNGLGRCSVIASSYGNRDYLLGSIGIVGPTRMNYSDMLSAIDYSSQKLSLAVSKFLD